MTDIELTPTGDFSLREAALFGFGCRHETTFDGVMRMAFVLDGHHQQVGVEVRQDDERVLVRVHGASGSARDAAVAQTQRILSLDHDGRAFEAVCRRDPILANLRSVARGLRPVLFASPYEAALWAVISTRRQSGPAIALRTKLARDHGRTFTLAGQDVPAVPTPRQLLNVEAIDGLPAAKVGWLHAIARAALAGDLDAHTLANQDPDEAIAGLQRLPGIGPFYATLIQVRATGAKDILPTTEPRLLSMVGRLYEGRDLRQLGEAWRPYRTWAAVLIRAVASRTPLVRAEGAAREAY